VVLGGFAAIFGAFAIRTALRHGTSLEIDEAELRATGLRQATIPWDRLDRMKLAYYSTRRDRKSGWMQLELGAGRARLSLDSRLGGFDRLVRHAATVAAERVRKSGTPYQFAPMSSRERRIVHLALRDEKDLRTESNGEGGRRSVVVYPGNYRTAPPAKRERRTD